MALKSPITFETTFNTFTGTEIVGEGGAAWVYRATDEEGKLYAVKLLKPQSTTREKRKRFKNEIDFCSRINHKNIVPVIGHGALTEGKSASVFYVMPLYSGSFRNLLEQGVKLEETGQHLVQLLDGVEAAHLKGVVHRDLKPENILYDDRNEQLVIADFGIAMFQEDELFTAVETKDTDRLANFRYAAPEQRHPGKSVDLRADIFTLGLILNEMFTGEVVSGVGYKTIADVVPEQAYLDEIVSQMIQQDPSARFSSVREIKQRLSVLQKTFLSQQKISELSGEVVPESEIDDPIVADPPKLIDFDWTDGALTLILSCPVNDKWVQALRKMGSHSFIWGKGPENFRFVGDRAIIGARESQVQGVIDYFKDWLPKANAVYEREIAWEKEKAQKEQYKRLQDQREKEEARKRVLEKVKL